ncbi:hypothetical protein MGA3_11960 [Bacillus methanolicus MGA3]|nr:hypothetical protein MGA3_11960 [Bacillus methanolicus MGA3]
MYPFFEKILETLPDASKEIEQLKKRGLKVSFSQWLLVLDPVIFFGCSEDLN